MKILATLAWFVSAATLAFGQQKTGSPSAASLSSADQAAIRAASKIYEQAGNDRDWPKLTSVFTDDIVWMPPNASSVTGLKAVRAVLDNYPRFRELKLEPLDIEGSGDLAYVRGHYSLISMPANQPEQPDAGKYIEIWRKQRDGQWKYARGIFNSDLPAGRNPPIGPAATASPSIVGTYRLVSRKLPDGHVVYPPSVNGLFSITPSTMNFNIVTEDSPGKFSSYSSIATYRLASTELSMTSLFESLVGDGKVVYFAGSARTSTTAAKISGPRVEYTPAKLSTPSGDIQGPLHVFDENGLIASKSGEFVDTWEKIVEGTSVVASSDPVVDDPVAAVRTAVTKHWDSINRGDGAWRSQHTQDMNLFMPEFEHRIALHSASGVAAFSRLGEATVNFTPREIQVQSFGNAAVASFYMDGSVTRKADGIVDSRPRRVTEVWVNDNGTWKEAHHHDSVYVPATKTAAAQ
jgi:ketosteroid isomerase-like protein